MSYNRWRNGSPNRVYKAVWLPSQKHELYHYVRLRKKALGGELRVY